jgi:hypothetical protein
MANEDNGARLVTNGGPSIEWEGGTDSASAITLGASDNGWVRESYTIKTNEMDNIMMRAYLVEWSARGGHASGDICIKNPKLEVGKNATRWSDYLK